MGLTHVYIDLFFLIVLQFSVFCRYACTAFAFGQTGSGKTHTITGPPELVSFYNCCIFEIKHKSDAFDHVSHQLFESKLELDINI